MTTPLTPAQANAVFDVLVEHAGATEDGRDGFVVVQANVHLIEYRFGGSLGFGGKFWRDAGAWYVTAYPEDVKRDPTTQDRIDAANRALAELDKQGASA